MIRRILTALAVAFLLAAPAFGRDTQILTVAAQTATQSSNAITVPAQARGALIYCLRSVDPALTSTVQVRIDRDDDGGTTREWSIGSTADFDLVSYIGYLLHPESVAGLSTVLDSSDVGVIPPEELVVTIVHGSANALTYNCFLAWLY